ncbi:hypothetical protein HG530_006269 [Fusarium avenaceum]|nr:hypothetical protein HG530_006269 [Fusarium avenaceum]
MSFFLIALLGSTPVLKNSSTGSWRIYHQHLLNQVGGASGHPLWYAVGTLCDLGKQTGNVLIVKRESANKKNIKNNTTTPYIYFRASIQLTADDFRGSVVWTAATCLEEVTVRHDITQAEIGDLDIEVLIEDHIAANKLLPSDNLEGDLLTGAIVDGKLDLSKGAFSQSSKNLVGADALFRLDPLFERRIGGARADRRLRLGCVFSSLLLLLLLLCLLGAANVGRG